MIHALGTAIVLSTCFVYGEDTETSSLQNKHEGNVTESTTLFLEDDDDLTNSTSSDSSTQSPAELLHEYLTGVIDQMYNIYSPVLIVTGIFGNVMSILIMTRPSFSGSTNSLYFIALAGIHTLQYYCKAIYFHEYQI